MMPKEITEGQEDSSIHGIGDIGGADRRCLDISLIPEGVDTCLPTDDSVSGVSQENLPSVINDVEVMPSNQTSKDLSVIDSFVAQLPEMSKDISDDLKEMQAIAISMHRHYADVAKNSADVDLNTNADEMARAYLNEAIGVAKLRLGIVEKGIMTILRPRVTQTPGANNNNSPGGLTINAPNATNLNITPSERAESRRNRIESAKNKQSSTEKE